MALSNSQYDQLMRDYEQLQLDNEHELRLVLMKFMRRFQASHN